MKVNRYWPCLFLFIYCSQYAQASGKLAQVKIELVKNFIIFQAQIGVSNPLNFIFDSAAGPTVVDSATAQKLNLIFSKSVHVGTASRTIDVKNSDQYQLTVGDILVKIDLVALELDHLSKYLGIEIDGILGVDLMKAFIVETNIDSHHINLYALRRYTYNGSGTILELTKFPSKHLGSKCCTSSRKNTEKMLVLKIDTAYPDFVILSPRGLITMNRNGTK